MGHEGREHLAFALDAASVGNMKGRGVEGGARGEEPALYFFDPNRHLLEIRRRG